jgi:sigma-B regulation protein RsbU (phosphoserine phosphatase)
MALGIDPDWTYTVQTTDWLQAGDIIFLGTDGIWETFNCDRAMFGKEAVKRVIFEHRDESADTILDAVFDAVAEFACETKIADDMTLIVVKAFPDRLPSSNI